MRATRKPNNPSAKWSKEFCGLGRSVLKPPKIQRWGNERHSRIPGWGFMRGSFAIFCRKGITNNIGSSTEGKSLEGCHRDIKGSGAFLCPSWGDRHLLVKIGSRGWEMGRLPPWRKGSRLRCWEYCITDGIMSVYPIPIASTPNMMVTERVSWRGANWAFFIFREQRETQPVSEWRHTRYSRSRMCREAERRRGNNIEPVRAVELARALNLMSGAVSRSNWWETTSMARDS